MNRRHLIAGAVLAAASFGLGGGAAWAADPVRIGFSIAKTGLFADAAPSQLNAYELWREQVNAAGGLDVAGTKRPVEFVQYDDQSNPGQAVRIYEKLITDDKVDLILAPWGTPHHFALAPVLEKYKFPMVGNSAASAQLRDIKPGYIWFPTSAIPDKIAPELVAMMKANKVTSVAILSSVLPFSKEIKTFLLPALKKEGIEVKVNEEYPPTTKDMTAMLTAVKKAKPDATIALSYPSDSVLFAKQAKEIGIESQFDFVLVGPTMDFYQKVVGASANNIVTVGHWSPYRADWTKAKPFYDAYVKKFNEIPDHLDSALAYISCEILQQAVAKAGLDKEKLREVISTTTFDTINGPVKFQGVENVATPTAFLQVQGDKIELVWPASIATAAYRPKTSW
ncbi:MAG: amino acid ABC transporter substrate-binding protein [Alphaproteobacteria bacterium]|jgi:branched-chain amino acid transport system substrate-binding protein|nr:amino acid ABC transporter substrate-binding protein [Alphaproteobacteria bacterium]